MFFRRQAYPLIMPLDLYLDSRAHEQLGERAFELNELHQEHDAAEAIRTGDRVCRDNSDPCRTGGSYWVDGG